ncbi:hypothetical protein FOL47_000735 [Perkinsus chesapeaki]|uniref:Uncharacterized protein n=1 Tax=Perkinsus chesapeaki TaxID=330153 RepID=A0A7J6KUG4_PERCH|nr:hypothetical protein FOL47_000735 [Perkinsus chesapeaki]
MPPSKSKQKAAAEQRAVAANERLQFLSLIEDNYSKLTGKFDATHTKDTRDECWKAIAATIIGDGLSTLWGTLTDGEVKLAKTGDPVIMKKIANHLRDNKWSDLRRRYTKNRGKLSKTGEGGGVAAQLDEQDLLVDRIVNGNNGEGKAAVSGLDVLSDGCSRDGDGVQTTTEPAQSDDGVIHLQNEDSKKTATELSESGLLQENQLLRRKRGRSITSKAALIDDLNAARIAYIKQKTKFYELSCLKLANDMKDGVREVNES